VSKAREVEVKYRILDLVALEATLRARGLVLSRPVHQDDQAYAEDGWQYGMSKLAVAFARLRAFVQVPARRGGVDRGIRGQLRHPGAAEEPSQQEHSLGEAAQRAATATGAWSLAFSAQRVGQEQHGLLAAESAY
jgi:hypothetical protein